MLLRLLGAVMLGPSLFFVGFAYGGLWGVQPPMVRELFGPSSFSFKYACSAAAAALGSIVMNEGVAGPIYEMRCGGSEGYSAECFNDTFVIALVADVVAVLLAIWLAAKTRWLYRAR